MTVLAASLTLSLGIGSAAAFARDDILTPAAITAFEQKLEGARTTQAGIAERVACLERQDATLVAERDADQLRLGQLVAHKRELESTLAQRRVEYDGFLAQYNDANKRLSALRADLDQLKAYKAAKEEAVRFCKDKWGILGFLCDVSVEIAQLTGQIRNIDPLIGPAEKQVNDAVAGMEAAVKRYDESQTQLTAAEADAVQTTDQINVAEASISRLQAALALLRPEVLRNTQLLNEFASALGDARRVDTADGRARTGRLVKALAARVDGVRTKSDALSDQTRAVLTPQQLTACLK
ncbi:hypothetical protein CFHF_17215 [Caulobacter flavus]|uniref:Uncharacterized protein n=1 Tax=Caulobacter flavus TaxID=1679497 RepID=A0A2N5CQI7_9CAUL|nr:hypothetical protein [Caulobacter flavus]AYV48727.1 hypothetical protein C1707_22050 [Caulobacter flavus]PLR10259.1 hypothetical protein CFHF_17215 [Caulobacter flavus]